MPRTQYISPGALRNLGIRGYLYYRTVAMDRVNTYVTGFDHRNYYPADYLVCSYGFSIHRLSSLPRPSGRGRRVMLLILMLSVFIGVWESKEL